MDTISSNDFINATLATYLLPQESMYQIALTRLAEFGFVNATDG